MKSAFDLVNQDIATPTVLDRRLYIPLPIPRVLYLVQDVNVVAPWNLCNSLLHKFLRQAKPQRMLAYI